jgi:Glycosyltransferase family 87
MTMSRRQAAIFATLLSCALGIALNLWIVSSNSTGWGVDFNQFYAASHLAGTGHLYDWGALRKLEAEHGLEVRTGRLPVVAYGMKALAWLPYPTARALWLAASLAGLIVFIATWPGVNRMAAAVAMSWSMPAALLLLFGQDTPFWLMFLAIGLLLLKKGRPRLAGLAFALCICKFHLALGIPIFLISQKRWKTLFSGAAAVGGMLAACFLIEGPAWPWRYLAAVSNPGFSPAHQRMPNLHGLSVWLPQAAIFELAGALALVALLWLLCSRAAELGVTGAAVAAAGLLLGRHGYANDCALLIPIAVLTIQRKEIPAWLKAWAMVLLSPLPTLLLASSRPYLGQLLIVGFVICAIQAAVKGVWRRTMACANGQRLIAISQAK